MRSWSLTTARPSTRMTLKWARLGTSCAASSRAAGRSSIRENRPICEAREVGGHLAASPPALQTKKTLPFSPADAALGPDSSQRSQPDF